MPEANVIKLVIDTNIWISFLIGKKITSLRDLIAQGKAKVYFSNELINEFLTVIQRPKLQKYFKANADYLVTGDQDLLILNPFKTIKILSPNDFEKIYL
jgi:uncharacterized protein